MAKKNKKVETKIPETPKIRDPDVVDPTPAAELFKKLTKLGMPSGKFEIRTGYHLEYLGYGAFMLDYPNHPQNVELTDHLIMCANRHFGWCELSFETLEKRVNGIVKEEAEAHE